MFTLNFKWESTEIQWRHNEKDVCHKGCTSFSDQNLSKGQLI